MTPEEKLDEVLLAALEESKLAVPGSDDFDDQMKYLRTLLDAKEKMSTIASEEKVKLAQIEADLQNRKAELESKERMDKAERELKEKELEAKERADKADRELKEKEIEAENERTKKENRSKVIEFGITTGIGVATYAAHEALTNARMNAGWNFEKTGIVTSPITKGLFQGLMKKW